MDSELGAMLGDHRIYLGYKIKEKENTIEYDTI